MKRYEDSFEYNVEKKKAQEWKQEHRAGGFRCSHCKQFVVINDRMGTANRNHCNFCLWSKHVDNAKGDRRATCKGGMEPIGLTFKHEGYGRVGEIMLIHLCSLCQKISINRIARDDPEDDITGIFDRSRRLEGAIKAAIKAGGIYLLEKGDTEELHAQLFGGAGR
jgi:hypothetical protein